MALTGAMFSAEEGLALGLVDEVAAKGEGVARAEALAADIAKRGPLAVQMVKAMINAAEGEDRDAPIEGLAGALTAFTRGSGRGRRRVSRQAPAGVYRSIGIAEAKDIDNREPINGFWIRRRTASGGSNV